MNLSRQTKEDLFGKNMTSYEVEFQYENEPTKRLFCNGVQKLKDEISFVKSYGAKIISIHRYGDWKDVTKRYDK